MERKTKRKSSVKVDRGTVLKLEVRIRELIPMIEELKAKRISTKELRFELTKTQKELVEILPQIEEMESTQTLTPREKAVRDRQMAEAQKARELRLSREVFEPKIDTRSLKQKEKAKFENWRANQFKPRKNKKSINP